MFGEHILEHLVFQNKNYEKTAKHFKSKGSTQY
jgi:hypothetical protein